MSYVETSGINSYYETEGTGPPLLLLHHGLLSSLEEYKTFGYTRAQRYSIILPCLLVGYGHQNYTWDSCRHYSTGSLPFWSNRHGLLQRSDKEGLTPTIFSLYIILLTACRTFRKAPPCFNPS